MDFISTNRGGRALCAEGYMYYLNRKGTGRDFWRCRNRLCTGNVVTKGTEIMSFTPHNHLPDDAKVR